jgi:hypothetical protein
MGAQMQQILSSEISTPAGAIRHRATPRLLSLVIALPQNSPRAPQQPPQMGIPPTVSSPNETFRERRIKQLNVERQKEMVSQANDLLKLTAQLNAEVAKEHSTSLTPDQLRTLAKIEKLAKSVREKMSNPVQGTIFEDNFPPPIAPPLIP